MQDGSTARVARALALAVDAACTYVLQLFKAETNSKLSLFVKHFWRPFYALFNDRTHVTDSETEI